MNRIVVDASALVEYLLGTDLGAEIAPIMAVADPDLHVPALCDVEVAAGLRRGIASGRLAEARARQALDHYVDLPITRHGHQALLVGIMSLRANFSAYDATYVTLARALDATLLTADRKLARATRNATDLRVLP